MPEALLLVIVVAASYLAARVAFDWLARRFVVISGAEYLLLGILLGPQVSGIVSPATVESFAPITTLGLGWMGALLGSQFVLPALVRIPAPFYRTALVESLLTFGITTAALTLALESVFAMPRDEALIAGVALGAVGVSSAWAGVSVVARQFPGGAIVRQLQVATGMNAVVGLLASGLLLAVVHPPPTGDIRALTATEWTAITIAIGVVGGVLFHLFLGDERKVDRLFVSLTGALILVSGAATYLRLSPLLSAVCFGAVLANSTRNRAEIVAALDRVERPLYFALLVLAGATWQPSVREWVLPVLLFLFVRSIAKVGAARLAARWNGMLPAVGAQWGRGLLGQGGLGLAIALNYLYQEALPLQHLVFTAAVASLLLTDLLSARFVRSLLHLDRTPAPADG